jgi:hypothetical protein
MTQVIPDSRALTTFEDVVWDGVLRSIIGPSPRQKPRPVKVRGNAMPAVPKPVEGNEEDAARVGKRKIQKKKKAPVELNLDTAGALRGSHVEEFTIDQDDEQP